MKDYDTSGMNRQRLVEEKNVEMGFDSVAMTRRESANDVGILFMAGVS